MDKLKISDIKTIDDLDKFVLSTDSLKLPQFDKYITYKYPAPLVSELLRHADPTKVKPTRGKAKEQLPLTDQPELDYTKLDVVKDTQIPDESELQQLPKVIINGFNYYIVSKTRLIGDDALFRNVLDMQKKMLKPHQFKLPESPYITDEIKAEVQTAEAELNEKHIPIMVRGLDDMKIKVRDILNQNLI